MIVLLVLIAALSAWGVVATAVAVRTDGYCATDAPRLTAAPPDLRRGRPAGAGR
jgi:hypothetical protein